MVGKGKMVYLMLMACVLIAMAATGFAAAHEKDVQGAKDHPLVSRYPDSFIKHYVVKKYDQYTLPLGKLEDRELTKSKTIEGRITRIQYQAPEDISTLQIFRNYQLALEKAGFDILFSASGKKLAEESSRWTRFVYPHRDAYAPLGGYTETQRYLAAKLARPKGDVYVSLYVIFSGWGDVPRTQLDIIEEKSLQTGLVEVNVDALPAKKAPAAPSKEVIEAAKENDVEGAEDHPLISRYPGSFIRHYVVKDYDQYTLPLGKLEEGELTETKTLEGKITRIQYQAPKDVSTLQVFRNYELALEKAGFDILFSASGKKLAEESSRWTRFVYPHQDAYAPLSGYTETQRYLAAKLARPEGDVYVSLYTVFSGWGDVPFVQLDIVEVKPLQTGLVRVNAEAIAQDIKRTGRATIYGIYFDTGKATIRPSSKPVIQEIAKFLKQNPDIDLYVVGHTDSQGGFDYNMDLSRRRAESVVNRLVSEYGVDEERLEPHGVAFLAPVATNATEKGRAKNRRVELVKK